MGGQVDDISLVKLPTQVSRSRFVRAWALVREKADARSLLALGMLVVVGASPIISTISLAVSGIVAATSLLFGLLPTAWVWLVVFALSLVSFVSTISAIFMSRSLQNAIASRRWTEDFRPLQLIFLCFVYSKEKITSRLEYIVKARKTIWYFESFYTWSGVGEITPRLADTLHSIKKHERMPVGSRRELVIDLGRTLKVGEIETIEFDLVSIATDPAQPYFATIINSPVHPPFNNHLMVAFAPSVKVSRILRETSLMGTNAGLRKKSVPDELSPERVVHWPVPPRFGLRYAFRWVYDEGQMDFD